MGSSFITRGILELNAVVRELEREEEAIEKIEKATEIIESISDIEIPIADNITELLDYDVGDDAVDSALEAVENAIETAAANVSEYMHEGWEALARTDGGDTDGGDKDGNEGLVFDHLFNIHAPCVVKGSAILVILLFVALIAKGCCSCGVIKKIRAWSKKRSDKKKAKAAAATAAVIAASQAADAEAGYYRRYPQPHPPPQRQPPPPPNPSGATVTAAQVHQHQATAAGQVSYAARSETVHATPVRKSRAGTLDQSEARPEPWETSAVARDAAAGY